MDDMKRGATIVCKTLFMDFCLRFLVYASSSNSTKFARFSRIKVHIRPHLVRRRRPLLLRAADGHCIFVHYFHLSTLYAHAFRLVTQLSVAWARCGTRFSSGRNQHQHDFQWMRYMFIKWCTMCAFVWWRARCVGAFDKNKMNRISMKTFWWMSPRLGFDRSK